MRWLHVTDRCLAAMEGEADRQTNRQTETQTQTRTDTQTGRQTEERTDRRETDRQTGRVREAGRQSKVWTCWGDGETWYTIKNGKWVEKETECEQNNGINFAPSYNIITNNRIIFINYSAIALYNHFFVFYSQEEDWQNAFGKRVKLVPYSETAAGKRRK